jgi:hypothetical protein
LASCPPITPPIAPAPHTMTRMVALRDLDDVPRPRDTAGGRPVESLPS